MTTKSFSLCAALVAAALLTGCATSEYPLTYTVPLGTATVTSAYGPPNLVVNGVQDVPATPGMPLYYSAISPVNVVVYVFDKGAAGQGVPVLSQMQGTSFYSSVTPTSGTVEFVFSAAQPNTGGSVQLTISNSAMTGSSNAVPYGAMGGPSNAAQPMVTLSPTNATVSLGTPVTLTASGGAGSGAYVWSGAASASGSGNAFTFNAPGTYTESVYRAGDASYAQSNTATSTIVVNAASAPAPAYNSPVSVTPIR